MSGVQHPKPKAQRPRPEAQSPAPVANPYIDGLKMLGRRELSETQVRQRLARKGHAADAVDRAITRLRDERAIDDTRVAEAIAHTETAVHRRGRRRVRRLIEHAGIASAIARHAVDTVFGAIDETALLEEALARRMRGRESIADERELARLFRYLVGQGFEQGAVMAALRKRMPTASTAGSGAPAEDDDARGPA